MSPKPDAWRGRNMTLPFSWIFVCNLKKNHLWGSYVIRMCSQCGTHDPCPGCCRAEVRRAGRTECRHLVSPGAWRSGTWPTERCCGMRCQGAGPEPRAAPQSLRGRATWHLQSDGSDSGPRQPAIQAQRRAQRGPMVTSTPAHLGACRLLVMCLAKPLGQEASPRRPVFSSLSKKQQAQAEITQYTRRSPGMLDCVHSPTLPAKAAKASGHPDLQVPAQGFTTWDFGRITSPLGSQAELSNKQNNYC